MYTASRVLINVHVAGMQYWDGALVVDRLRPGSKLKLELEADNPYDPNAVKVLYKGVKLGYLPRANNELFAQLLRFGHADVVGCRVLAVKPEERPWNQVFVSLYVRDAAKRGKKRRKR
ncbi:MAG: HIRAN domain-containing protein [Collinsella sp.]|nr:HIRAN domain-containing protein [Collinsella sp.]